MFLVGIQSFGSHYLLRNTKRGGDNPPLSLLNALRYRANQCHHFCKKKSLHTKVQARLQFTKKEQQGHYITLKSVGQFWGKLWQFGAIIYMIQHRKSAILRGLAVCVSICRKCQDFWLFFKKCLFAPFIATFQKSVGQIWGKLYSMYI